MKRLALLLALTTVLGGVAIFVSSAEVRATIGDLFTGDPDAPPWAGADFDEADYLIRRDQFVSLLRGIDPDRPADPASRSRAIEHADVQRARILASVQNANELSVKQNATSIRSGSTGFAQTATDDLALSPLLNPPWVELGPNPIPLGQTSGARTNVSGRTTAIEIDPANPSTVYVGTAQGGLYRSLDGGATWTTMMDSALSLAIGSLTLDTSTVPNRLWVGTGEANGSADSFAGVGLYRIDNPSGAATLVGPFNPVRNYTDSSNNAQSTPALQGRSVSRILISPTNHDTLMVGAAGGVIGLGGNPPFGNSIPPLAMRGLYRLDNMGGAPALATATRIAVSTTDTAQGLCLDNPCTVNRNVNDMVFDPSDNTGNTLIVWLNGVNIAGDGGIYRSTNALSGSPTFAQKFVTTANSTSNARGQFVVASQGVNPARIYVASGEASTLGSNCNSAANVGGLRRSDDGGQTWSTQLFGGGGFCQGQCFYNIGFDIVAGAAANTDKLFLGGNVSSTSGGRACARQESTSLDGGATAFTAHDSQTHADTHVIKVAPSDPNTVYRGDDGGIWKSTDGGNTFVPLNNSTFRATQFQSIAVHPTDMNITLGGTQDNGTEAISAAGPTWLHSDDGDGGFAMIDQGTPLTMYHTYFNQTGSQIGWARSLTGGGSPVSWSFLGCSNSGTTNGFACSAATTTAVNFYAPTALSTSITPNNVVYFGTDRLLRSATQGTNVVTVSQAPLTNAVPISSIAISPQDDNYRIVGQNNGGVWFTTTGSSTLTSLDPVGAGSAIPDFYVARVAFDPTNKETAYITLGNYANGTAAAQSHIWKVTNLSTGPVITSINGTGGNILPDVPVNGFAIDPTNPATLFAGTDIGVFATNDGGVNWTSFGTGLPRVAVFDMAVLPNFRILRIATHGRGMWQASLAPTAAAVTVAGRVADSSGAGVRGATVSFTDTHGVAKTVLTNAFGYYSVEVMSGESYVAGVSARRLSFTSRFVNVNDSLTGIDFTPR